MPKTVITPPGTGTPIAPFSPGTLADGVVYVKELAARRVEGFTRHFSVANLEAADVTIYPDPVALANGKLRLNSRICGFKDGDKVEFQTDPRRGCVTVRGYTGALYVTW